MLLKILRNGLGSIVVFIDWVTRPSRMERSTEEQLEVEAKLKDMTLYQLYACPFCIKTRRVLRRLNLPMETRSVSVGSPFREELESGGGMIQVPCLRLQQDGKDIWMYESSDIIQYLEEQFNNSPVSPN